MSIYELKPSTQWGKNLIPTLNNIFNKLSDKIDDVNTNIIDIKNDLILKLETAQNTANTALKIAEESKAISLDLKEEMNKILNYCETLKTENINLKQNVNQLDNYSRRNNLVIGGIEEKDNEQCEKLVRPFFKDKLKLDSNSVNHMRIVGCHRLGKQFGHRGRPRSIIVRFLDYNDRHIVWMAKKNINDKTLSINEHFCGDTEFKRRKLYPIYRAAKKKESNLCPWVYIRLETLYLFVQRICLLLPSVSLLLISTLTQMFITKSVGTETLMLSHIVCAEKYTIQTYVAESLNRKPIDSTHQTKAHTMHQTDLYVVVTPAYLVLPAEFLANERPALIAPQM